MPKRLKGLEKDAAPIDMPEGKYSDARNILLTKRKGAIASEEGAEIATYIPEGYDIIGDTLVYDGRHILFLANDSSSKIGVFYYDEEQEEHRYEDVLDNPALSFSTADTIEAINMVNDYGQVVVYWTDNNNPPRFLNIDRDELPEDLDSISIFPTVETTPVVNLESVNSSGGDLLTGSYYFGISLIDDDGGQTEFMNISPPVYINDDSSVSSSTYDGAPAGTPTNKSINLTLSGLDVNYSSYELAVIRKEQGTIADVVVLPEQAFASEESSYLFTSLESGLDIALEEVLVGNAFYKKAKTIAQANNTLYLGNLEGSSEIDFQKFANSIEIESVEKPVGEQESSFFNDAHYGDPIISFYDKSFKRGEVYAFYISFTLRGGGESQAFHIPGREATGNEKETVDPDSEYGKVDDEANNFHFKSSSSPDNNSMGYWENASETYPPQEKDDKGDWEVWTVNHLGEPLNTGQTLHGKPVRHHHFPRVTDGSSFYTADGFSSLKQAHTLGIKLKNLEIPNNLVDRITGIKIYYAKRTDANKRIIDQAHMVPAYLTGKNDRGEQVIGYRESRGDVSNRNSRWGIVTPFHTLRTKSNVGNIAYVEKLYTPSGHNHTLEGHDIFCDQTENYDVSDEYSRAVNASAIIASNSYGETQSKGFDHNTRNIEGEESVILQFDMQWNFDEFVSQDAMTQTAGHIVDLRAHKKNVYVPFQNQELVWTGYIETNIAKFCPSLNYNPDDDYFSGTKAQGSIQVISGTQGGVAGDSFSVSLLFTSDTFSTIEKILLTPNSNMSEVATEIKAHLDNTQIADNYDISLDGGLITFSAKTVGKGNKMSIVKLSSSDSLVEVPIGSNTTHSDWDYRDESVRYSDAIDLSDNDINIVNSIDYNFDLEITQGGGSVSGAIQLSSNGEDWSSVVSEYLRGDPSQAEEVVESFSGTIELDEANYIRTVVRVRAGQDVERCSGSISGSISQDSMGDQVITGASFSIDNIEGGEDPEEVPEKYETQDIFGGDTFISAYAYRRTGVTGDWDEYHRHLFYFVCESADNIRMRHSGGSDGDIYYPKQKELRVLQIEENIEEEGYFGNFIGYNRDYSDVADLKSAIPNNPNSRDIQKFPTRIIRSVDRDGSNRGVRTFLANDYMDLTRSRGDLITLSVMHNVLIPHMQRALIRTRGREELAVGDIRAFVGAGDIFSVQPDEIISTKTGFAGLQDPKTAISTPFGYFFVDRQARSVYLLSERPEPISDFGLHNFFRKELSECGKDELIAGYDSKWNRILLTRKGKWTLSYYPELKCWASFHNYNPQYYLYDVETFYSKRSNGVYKHNVDGKPCTFYGTRYPMEFEFIDNRSPAQSKLFANIQFITDVEDDSGNTIIDETFNSFRVSNNHQDSGDKDIIYFTSPGGNARRVEDTWKINKFRDMMDDGEINLNKPWYNQSKFISKYLKVKLTFNNSDNKSLYLYDANVGMKVSHR